MKNLSLSLLALALFSSIAHAQNIVVNTDAPTFGPDSSSTQFSLVFPATTTPAGYSLVSATLRIFGSQSASLTAVNMSAQNQTARIFLDTDVYVSSNSMDSTLLGYDTGLVSVLNTGTQTYAPSQSRNFGPSTVNFDTTATTVTNASAYLAGGTITGDILNGTAIAGGGGNIAASPTQTTTLNGRIAFTFAPIVSAAAPEPGTLGLLALGGGLVLVKRRRAN